jgi:hypothetical protein
MGEARCGWAAAGAATGARGRGGSGPAPAGAGAGAGGGRHAPGPCSVKALTTPADSVERADAAARARQLL